MRVKVCVQCQPHAGYVMQADCVETESYNAICLFWLEVRTSGSSLAEHLYEVLLHVTPL